MGTELYVICVKHGQMGSASIELLAHFPKSTHANGYMCLDYGDGVVFDCAIDYAEDDATAFKSITFERPQMIDSFIADVFTLLQSTSSFCTFPDGDPCAVARSVYLKDMPDEMLDDVQLVETLESFSEVL